MYSETTRSINVTVKPFYLEDQSSPAENHYFWAYHVRIENRGGLVVPWEIGQIPPYLRASALSVC